MRRDPKSTITGRCLGAGLGPKRTTAVLTLVALWSMYRAVEDRDPLDIEELAEDLQRNLATLYRWFADFRLVFEPEGWETPGELLDAVGVARAKWLKPREVGVLGVAAA